MEFIVRENNGVIILELVGDMVGGPDATLLLEKLRELTDQKKTRILLDMKKVQWMNSSGLGILIGCITTVRHRGGELKLLHLGKKPKELLKITRLEQVFAVFDDEDKALRSF